jgi:hypothetical protein
VHHAVALLPQIPEPFVMHHSCWVAAMKRLAASD